MIRESIARLVEGRDLPEAEMVEVMEEIMTDQATGAQIGALLTALRMKGETVAEITGAARVMRDKATPVEAAAPGELLMDIVGTGGDLSGTFNVSTTSALVVAAAGVAVAKHGNRSVSSRCGSADVLEALGVDLDLSPEQIGRCVRQVGIGFMFAPKLHGAMKHAIGPRREIGIRTLFNLLGPLTNPARANAYLLGVYDAGLTEKVARVLINFGVRRAMVVWGEGNIDELTVTAPSRVSEVCGETVRTYTLTPEEMGLSRAPLAAVKGGATPEESAALVREVLNGASGPRREMVLLNAGAALMVAGRAEDVRHGVELAAQLLDSGQAAARLQALVEFCAQNQGARK